MIDFLATVLRVFIALALICLFFWVLWQMLKIAVLIFIIAVIFALLGQLRR